MSSDEKDLRGAIRDGDLVVYTQIVRRWSERLACTAPELYEWKLEEIARELRALTPQGRPFGLDRERLREQAPAMASMLVEFSKRGEGSTSSWIDIEDLAKIRAVLRDAGVVE